MNLFKKKKYVTISIANDDYRSEELLPQIPDGTWVKCKQCNHILHKQLIGEFMICNKCGGYFRLTAWERIFQVCDKGTFIEFDKDMKSANPLDFPHYNEKTNKLAKKIGINDAVVTGKCTIQGEEVYLAAMDSNFIMGSMGSVVGEKLTRLFENATQMKKPVVIFCASGGARMQEGIVSLMQMAKVSAAVKMHSDSGQLYISVLTDPTTGGVTASFASLGDIILAEEKALIGFAGRRVIEQTLNEKLPDDFQSAEYLKECGFIDRIIKREEIPKILGELLEMHKEV